MFRFILMRSAPAPPSRSVQVQAQVSGQIVERHFKDGADVKKGDLLFTIDKRPYQAALDAAKADNISWPKRI